ncbi:hypothetical protein [Chryseobacterium sp. NKUCC03_KSP]|uniref:hypothetical protein n=1 Tax=Chryseobacterium sp. NKUCC03_KSP TaxID=2842125 RepID=UPI001C5BA6D0|nr:hypothetical protein [Chryseobacterium sp. NKUCC03_KSP]MBW3521966.1 hypothetical protein [Chryseobacterium sp. NKUCC03_KSP]
MKKIILFLIVLVFPLAPAQNGFNTKNKGSLYIIQTLENLNHNTTYFNVKNLNKRKKSADLPPLHFGYFFTEMNFRKIMNTILKTFLKDMENS